jgi:hypothetical protein
MCVSLLPGLMIIQIYPNVGVSNVGDEEFSGLAVFK